MEPFYINTLRDVAISLENKNKQIALDLMDLALTFRPEGLILINKVNEYTKLLTPSSDTIQSLLTAIDVVEEALFLNLLNTCLYLYPNNADFLLIKNKVGFSHRVDLEKVSALKVDIEYDVVPFGSRCTSAIACHYAQLIKESLPFDWAIPLLPARTQNILEENFQHFIPSNIGEKRARNTYGVGLAHFDAHENRQDGIDIYNLRVERFNKLMQSSKHKYFVYVNEDYLYNKAYRGEVFNKGAFEEMLSLEDYIKGRYPHFSFNILYFDFVSHKGIEGSSIVPFVIETGKFWDQPIGSTFPSFRKYIGKALCGLFKTEFDDTGVILIF